MSAFDLSHMFTQSIKFPVYYHILTYIKELQMFEKGDSSNRQWNQFVAPFSKLHGKIWVGFCLNTDKNVF